MNTTLRFAPGVLTHLGEGLVPAIDQAIIELVKNAYDADATKCEVTIDDVPNGTTLQISDNGKGMTAEELRDGWLLLGSSQKARNRRTSRFNRVVVGDKGLGRLAALRLGECAEVRTKSAVDESPWYLCINWRDYRTVSSVDEVNLLIEHGDHRRAIGTSIRITGCPPMTDSLIRRLARSLMLLNDPFRGNTGFTVVFSGSAAKRARINFTKRFFPYARYRLRGRRLDDGSLAVRLTDEKNVEHTGIVAGPFHTVPFTFDLWEFRLAKDSFSAKDFPLEDIREWLRIFGGVHLFSGPIRIAPYGDRPVDWLDMNAMRAADPQQRPSTNNSIGRVTIDNNRDEIIQTTDRVSFVDNEPYRVLRDACREILKWANGTRKAQADRDHARRKERLARSDDAATAAYDALRANLSRSQLELIEPVVSSALSIKQEEVEALRADVVLYRAMATAGIAASVFAHEIGQPLLTLNSELKTLVKVTSGKPDLQKALTHVIQATERLAPYVKLPMHLASKARRRTTKLDAVKNIDQTLDLLKPILDERDIDLLRVYAVKSATIRASPAMLDAILSNLITNSITAFKKTNRARKRVRVSLDRNDSTFTMRYADNGGGINGLALEKIWVPGETTTPGGTGFGLTIVRDTMLDMKGSVTVKPHTRFGGAEFTFTLPMVTP